MTLPTVGCRKLNFDLTSTSLACNFPRLVCRVLQNARAFLFNPIQVRNAMSKSTSNLLTRAVTTVFVVLLAQLAIRSQVSNARVAVNSPAIPSSKIESTTDERLKALDEELQSQRKSLDEMRSIISEHRTMIEQLLAKGSSSGPRASDRVADVVTTATAPLTDIAQTQAQPIEDRVKKLESKVLSIGPFRFSGDFRLRLDGIFRGADNTPPTGLAPLTY